MYVEMRQENTPKMYRDYYYMLLFQSIDFVFYSNRKAQPPEKASENDFLLVIFPINYIFQFDIFMGNGS